MTAIVNHSLRRYFQTTAKKAAEISGPSAVSGGHEGSYIMFIIPVITHFIFAGGYKVWRNISLFVALPAIALCAVNCYLSHINHTHERPEFVKYDYLRVRTKRFPWGDGQHSLFHNPHVNPLPDGYEEH